MADSEIRDQTSWNLSEYKINIIGNLMQQATRSALIHNYNKSLDCWKQIALIIDNRLEKKEREKLEDLEKEIIEKGIKIISEQENSNLDDSDRIVHKPIFGHYAREYSKYVNELLKNVGMDMKTKDWSEEELD